MSNSYKLKVGFGLADITPEESVPLTSYGDDLRRYSTCNITAMEARAVAITDEEGQTLILMTGDHTWVPWVPARTVFDTLEQELGVPRDHIFCTGNHTHASVACQLDHLPEVQRYNEKYTKGMIQAAKLAYADRKPATVYAGSTITERMNFVRRYIMDDGSYTGDCSKGTGTCVVAHESQADPELQLVRFTREGGKDILIANFQTHPHIEGKDSGVSSQLAGAFRDEAEQRLDVHCMYWNGGAGNINSHSRIKQEMRAFNRHEWGKIMVDYTQATKLHRVKAGPIRIASREVQGKVNHTMDHMLDVCDKVIAYHDEGHNLKESMLYARTLGINSFHHAKRIVANSQLADTKSIKLQSYSFGDIGGIVLPYELFDTTCMHIKRNSPFKKTMINGYGWPSYCGYIPSLHSFSNGGYEADNCTFVPGTAEMLADNYLELLYSMENEREDT